MNKRVGFLQNTTLIGANVCACQQRDVTNNDINDIRAKREEIGTNKTPLALTKCSSFFFSTCTMYTEEEEEPVAANGI